MVRVWVAFLPTPLVAVMVTLVVWPASAAAGVPEIVAVPFLAGWNDRPFGSLPFSVSVGSGEPVALTVKLTRAPCLKLTDEFVVILAVLAGTTLSTKVVTTGSSKA